jgi:tellurite resistance protein TehA-like permease
MDFLNSLRDHVELIKIVRILHVLLGWVVLIHLLYFQKRQNIVRYYLIISICVLLLIDMLINKNWGFPLFAFIMWWYNLTVQRKELDK